VGDRGDVARRVAVQQPLPYRIAVRLIDVAPVLELRSYVADLETDAADGAQLGAMFARIVLVTAWVDGRDLSS
jgi:hypothetical protein